MIISVFADGEKRDKIAEFYDVDYPTSFLRGILIEAINSCKDAELTITCRQDARKTQYDKMMMTSPTDNY